jgi:hypothetical protein
VEKQTLLRKLEAMLDEAERGSTWGTIEIELREGIPNLLRKSTTEKLQDNTGGNTRARYHK